MKLRDTFNKMANEYHFYRPDYPEGLIKEIFYFLGLENPNTLEIGCGTGKATLPFLKMGANITAVDPGDNLIKIAKEYCSKFSSVKFVCKKFEEFEERESTFDLIFSAQAFHWIPPKIGLPKVKKLLKPGGYFLILRIDPYNEGEDRIGEKLDQIIEKNAPGLFKEHANRSQEAKANYEYFEKIRKKYFTLEKELYEDFKIPFTGESLCRYLDTTSIFQLFNEDQKKEAFEEMKVFLRENGDERVISFRSKAWIYRANP